MVVAGLNLTRITECSAMRNRGVNEAFTEAARVALSVKPAKAKESSKLEPKAARVRISS